MTDEATKHYRFPSTSFRWAYEDNPRPQQPESMTLGPLLRQGEPKLTHSFFNCVSASVGMIPSFLPSSAFREIQRTVLR
jgi:hypothetical protein